MPESFHKSVFIYRSSNLFLLRSLRLFWYSDFQILSQQGFLQTQPVSILCSHVVRKTKLLYGFILLCKKNHNQNLKNGLFVCLAENVFKNSQFFKFWKRETARGWGLKWSARSGNVFAVKYIVFSRRFRRKSRLLQWLVFFRQFTRSVHFLCINAHLPNFTICT